MKLEMVWSWILQPSVFPWDMLRLRTWAWKKLRSWSQMESWLRVDSRTTRNWDDDKLWPDLMTHLDLHLLHADPSNTQQIKLVVVLQHKLQQPGCIQVSVQVKIAQRKSLKQVHSHVRQCTLLSCLGLPRRRKEFRDGRSSTKTNSYVSKLSRRF